MLPLEVSKEANARAPPSPRVLSAISMSMMSVRFRSAFPTCYKPVKIDFRRIQIAVSGISCENKSNREIPTHPKVPSEIVTTQFFSHQKPSTIRSQQISRKVDFLDGTIFGQRWCQVPQSIIVHASLRQFETLQSAVEDGLNTATRDGKGELTRGIQSESRLQTNKVSRRAKFGPESGKFSGTLPCLGVLTPRILELVQVTCREVWRVWTLNGISGLNGWMRGVSGRWEKDGVGMKTDLHLSITRTK